MQRSLCLKGVVAPTIDHNRESSWPWPLKIDTSPHIGIRGMIVSNHMFLAFLATHLVLLRLRSEKREHGDKVLEANSGENTVHVGA